MSVYFDLKPQLNVAQVISTIPGGSAKECNIDVKKTCIVIHSNDVESIHKLKPPYGLQPTSCHGLVWSPYGELHLRLQMTTSEPSLPDVTEDVSRAPLMMQQIESANTWHCYKCGHKIVTLKKRFERVLPLPSEAWAEMSNNLFCCNHGDSKAKKNGESLSINPRDKDCLVADYYCLVHPGFMGSNKQHVTCDRCRHTIGQTVFKKGTQVVIALKFYFSAIRFSEPLHKESSDVYCFDWEQFFISQLCTQKRLHTSFKFLIEMRDDDGQLQPYLLLWVFDTNSAMDCHIIQRGVQDVTPVAIVKILYKTCLGGKNHSDVETWRHDIAVTPLELPHMFILKLVSILKEGTTQIPCSLRKVDGFLVSSQKRCHFSWDSSRGDGGQRYSTDENFKTIPIVTGITDFEKLPFVKGQGRFKVRFKTTDQ